MAKFIDSSDDILFGLGGVRLDPRRGKEMEAVDRLVMLSRASDVRIGKRPSTVERTPTETTQRVRTAWERAQATAEPVAVELRSRVAETLHEVLQALTIERTTTPWIRTVKYAGQAVGRICKLPYSTIGWASDGDRGRGSERTVFYSQRDAALATLIAWRRSVHA